MHVFHPMTSVLGTVWHPTRSYLQGTDKEQRVHEKQKTTYKNPKVKRSLTLLQHHRSKASILQCSAFFTVQLSHPYMTTRKTIGLTLWVVVSKATSLPLNAELKFVLPLLPWSKRLLNSCLQSPSAVTLEPMKIKSVTASTLSPFYLPWSNGTRCHGISFLNAVFQACFFILLSHPHSEAL